MVWVGSNRGICREIAKATKKTPQFINLVLYGKKHSSDGRIEQMLKNAGAPIRMRGE